MKNGIRLLAVLISLQCISLHSAIVIENITVIDAKNEVRNGQTVFIENGLIQSIGSTLDSSIGENDSNLERVDGTCLLYTSPSPRDLSTSRMPSSA